MLDRPTIHQRTRGRADVALGPDGRPRRLFQSGSVKAMLPRVHAPAPEVVFLNTAGGLTGGDSLSIEFDLAAGAVATGTTQTAERVYASLGTSATVEVTLTVHDGAEFAWLPQETILFDRAALDRRTTLRLGKDARALMLETLVLGRRAMGETLSRTNIIDRRRIETADGEPLFVEAVGLDAEALDPGTGPAGLHGHRAFATLVLAGPGAEDRLGLVRDILGEGRDAAASAVGGCLVMRLRAPDARPVRALVAQLAQALMGRPMPRVWQT